MRFVNLRILSGITGVIHVGASIGQERDYYANLNVLWFEPNPEAFQILRGNIAAYPLQQAYRLLLADKNNDAYTLHVTNGAGQASSIYDMKEQLRLYPDFTYVKDVQVSSITLDTFIYRFGVSEDDFQYLVLDTQGADLLVLKGAVNTLKWLKYVEVETSPLEMYDGGCLEQEVIDFMASQGFVETERMVVTPGVDNHILFERVACEKS